MDLTYHIIKYDGPLDLLLDLVQTHKMDIYDIPIVELTEQFLSYIKQQEENNLEISSEFIVMASQLLWIKSKMLLPKNKDEDSEEDPREELSKQLLEYQKYKNASQKLAERQNNGAKLYEGKRQYIEPGVRDYTLKNLDIIKLFEALNDVLERKDFIDKKPTPKDFTKIMQKNRTPIISKVKKFLSELEEMGQLSFLGCFESCESKDEIIASFLAILELLKLNKIGFEKGVIIKV